MGRAWELARWARKRGFDLAVPRQRCVVEYAQALRGLQLRLVVVADPAFGHEPCGFMGQAATAFVRPGLGVLLGVLSGVAHDDLRGWHDDGEKSPPRPAGPATER